MNDQTPYSGGVLHLKPVVDLGSDNLISITPRPDNQLMYVTTQTGQVHQVDSVGNASIWFDYNALVNTSIPDADDGYTLTTTDANHGGLRAVAFHPDFATNGLFYTSAAIGHPTDTTGINYLGNSATSLESDSAVVEWAYDFQAGAVDPNSYRELFRVKMPVYDHPIKQIAFNHYAQPGDEDYGLLYIAHGDGSVQSAIAGGGLKTDDALGKVLRINPLQDAAQPYTTPNNPYNDTPGTLNEIYTLGHRNPHNLSFALDDQGNSHVIVAEIGRDNIEEVNILQRGGNYGWSDREGTFVHLETGGYVTGVAELPTNEWELNDYIYPAVQYDHDAQVGAGFVGSAIVGGMVLDHPDYAALDNQYIFADFGTFSGYVYQADWSQMLAAHTHLADGEAPSTLTQAPIGQVLLTLDLDGDGQPDRLSDSLNTLLEVPRNDVRFGRGADGTMYLTSKKTGAFYIVAGTSGSYGVDAGSRRVFSETFSYADGALAGNNGAGNGWIGPWLGSHDIKDGQLASESGGIASRAILGHQSGQTMYFSFEIMATQDADETYTAWLQLDDNPYDLSNDGIQIGLDDGMYSLRINGTSVLGDFGNYTPGEKVLIVGKLVFNVDGTHEQVTAWVNPSEFEQADVTNTIIGDVGFTLIQSVEINEYDFDGNQILFDNILLGTTWADVVTSALLRGDLDADGDVDDSDLGTSFASYTGPVGAQGLMGTEDGDTDGDGDVDDSDLGNSFANYTGPIIDPGLIGDADGDGDIDDSDLGTTFANYTGPAGAQGFKTAAEGDTDGDGDVDDSDLGSAFANYTGPLATTVPEPTSLAALSMVGLFLLRRERIGDPSVATV